MFKFEHLTIEGNDELGSYSELEIDDKVFPLAVILKTAYWFTERCYLQIRQNPADGHFFVTFRSKYKKEDLDENVPGEFCNALVDQSVRLKVQEETQEIQTIIVKRAFAEGLSKQEQEILKRIG